MVLGTYPQLSLVDARLKLADAKKQLDAGQDPGALVAEARRAARSAATVAELVNEYLTRHAARMMRPATIKEETRILTREIPPHRQYRKAEDITRRDVMTILNGIEDRGKYVMRNRVSSALSQLLLFGLTQGLAPASPAAQLSRLRKICAHMIEKPRTRVLTVEEMKSFWLNVETILSRRRCARR
jgi:integrase